MFSRNRQLKMLLFSFRVFFFHHHRVRKNFTRSAFIHCALQPPLSVIIIIWYLYNSVFFFFSFLIK